MGISKKQILKNQGKKKTSVKKYKKVNIKKTKKRVILKRKKLSKKLSKNLSKKLSKKINKKVYLRKTKQYIQYYETILNKVQKYKTIENKYKFLSSEHNKDLNIVKSIVIRDILENLKQISATKKKINLIYPNIYDPNFNKKIYKKEEFYVNRIPNNPAIISKFYKEYAEGKINTDLKYKPFVLSPTQKLLKNFMNPDTPYNSLLIFHGVGVGKTCSSISIMEQFKEQIRQLGKKILVIRPQEIKDQLFDINKVKKGIPNDQCTGSTYLDEINEPELVTKCQQGNNDVCNNINDKIKKSFRKYYELLKPIKWVNFLEKKINQKTRNLPEEIKRQRKKEFLQDLYSNSVILIDEVHHFHESGDAVNKKKPTEMLFEVLKHSQNVKLIMLSATPMFDKPENFISLINFMLVNDNRPKIHSSQVFDKDGKMTKTGRKLLIDSTRGYISFMRGENPIQFPIRLSSSVNDPRKTINTHNWSTKNIYGRKLKDKDKIEYLDFFRCNMQATQKKVYDTILKNRKSAINVNTNEGEVISTAYQTELQVSNFVYQNLQESHNDVTKCYGRDGLYKIFESKGATYSFIDDKYATRFKMDGDLKKNSCKIWEIINNIRKCKGLVFIYTQFVHAGLLPLIFCLEMEGYRKYKSPPILNYSGKNKSNGFEYVVFGAEKAVWSRHSKHFKNLGKDMLKTNVKVIIGTSVAAEGLSFFGVREIHILDPWYNMNRVEQAIGRGIRTLSHHMLLPAKRNITIYLYVSYIKDKESVDMYLYKLAEKKAIKIGEVEHLLKTNAIDCHLNKKGNIYSQQDYNKPIKIETSRGIIKNIQIYDKPYSRLCNYYKECDYKCMPEIKNLELNKPNSSTYDLKTMKYDIKLVERTIINLISNNNAYSLEDLMYDVNDKLKIDKDIIVHKAIDNLINNKTQIIDEYGRTGYLIYYNNHYVFHPDEIKDIKSSFQNKIIPLNIKTDEINLRSYIQDLRKEKELSDKKEQYTYTHVINELIYKQYRRIKTKQINSIFITSVELNKNEIYNIVIDKLKFQVKKVLLTHLVKKMIEKETLNEREKTIVPFIQYNLIYYNDLYHQSKKSNNEIFGFMIIHKNIEILVYAYNNGTFELNEGIRDKVIEHKKYQFRKEFKTKEPSIIGFLFYDKKVKIPVFKIKDNTKGEGRKSVTGVRCLSNNKSVITSYINILNPKISNEKRKTRRDILCHDVEIMLRRKNNNKDENKKWFYNVEEFVIYQMSTTKNF